LNATFEQEGTTKILFPSAASKSSRNQAADTFPNHLAPLNDLLAPAFGCARLEMQLSVQVSDITLALDVCIDGWMH
jgi:hypothetical protein